MSFILILYHKNHQARHHLFPNRNYQSTCNRKYQALSHSFKEYMKPTENFPTFNPPNLNQKAMPEARPQPSVTVSLRMYLLVVTAVRKSFVYEDSKLAFIQTPVGRIVPDHDTYAYEYFLRVEKKRKSRNLGNHLGNTRVVFNEQGEVLQDNSYYPFGGIMKGLNFTAGLAPENKYLYNGKEMQDDFGLDWYDYGARFYDAQLGRWHVIDPKAKDYSSLSPYSYVANNPLKFIDPDGKRIDEYVFNAEGKYTGKVEKPGEHTGLILGSENSKPMTFKFADPVNDPKDIEKGNITGVEVVGDDAIAEALDDSGVNNAENQENKVDYILNESDASNLDGEGKMDYVVTAKINIDDQKQPISSSKLYVTQTESGAVAHNNKNFGNFLWGAGARTLGFSLITSKIGAHYANNKKHGGLDSKDDQYSIGLGYRWKKSKE